MSVSPVVGLVLAGGRSVRFGSEKAIALLDQRPLFVWAAERLRTVCGNVAINARSGTETEVAARAHGFAIVYDVAGDALGPLAGVKAGLMWAEGQGAHTLAVSPCDAPSLPIDLYVRLLEQAAGGAAMAETRDGHQPLCSLWPVSLLPAIREALADGAHPPTWRVLQRVGARQVLFEPPEAFANINTLDDLAAVEAARANLRRA